MKIPDRLSNLYKMACRSDATVLITGPTGTGKTTLASEIHGHGKRHSKPFVVINLASLHEGTFESELFGHEKGAFTGADQKRQGKIELAQGGTVFLDEIGELPLRLQARLLDFMQTRRLCPMGSNREVALDVRIIAATNKDLGLLMSQNLFREDLFHRLRVIEIQLEPLAKRFEDFELIFRDSLKELSFKYGHQVPPVASSLFKIFMNYKWPGNIRELRNVIEYLVVASEGLALTPSHLPPWFVQESATPRVESQTDLRIRVQQLEKAHIQEALTRNRGRINRTAQEIGMNKATLIRRVKAYHINI